jgi:plastocyanin
MTTILRLPKLLTGLALIATLLTVTPALLAQNAAVVSIKHFMFEPMSLTVHPGTNVTWKNFDGEPHLVVSADGLFRSPALDQGDTFSYRFNKPGTYSIFCSIHPNMRATIVVR